MVPNFTTFVYLSLKGGLGKHGFNVPVQPQGLGQLVRAELEIENSVGHVSFRLPVAIIQS
jgi:hypothetical protein